MVRFYNHLRSRNFPRNMSNKLNFELEYPIDDDVAEETIRFCHFVISECEKSIVKKTEREAKYDRSKGKKTSHADKIRELQNDIKYAENNVIEYTEEVAEAKIELEKLLAMTPEEKKDSTDGKIKCECSSLITKGGKSKHIKSKKHLDYLATLENDENDENES